MESMFKKEDRMLAYAYALNKFLTREPRETDGICNDLRDFLKESLEYDMDKFFFMHGFRHFPELWEEKTREIGSVYDNWFNNNQERIQALQNILKSN